MRPILWKVLLMSFQPFLASPDHKIYHYRLYYVWELKTELVIDPMVLASYMSSTFLETDVFTKMVRWTATISAIFLRVYKFDKPALKRQCCSIIERASGFKLKPKTIPTIYKVLGSRIDLWWCVSARCITGVFLNLD